MLILVLLGVALAGVAQGQPTTITEFPIPTADSAPYGITAGPDGNLWFTESGSNASRIGRITPAGVITEFAVPSAGPAITAGPDGNLWYTGGDSIWRITTAGVVTGEFPIPGSAPMGITAGPDGNLWFTEAEGDKIGRITTAGVITEFPLPDGGSFHAPFGIVAGPDGNLWFAEMVANQIGRITPAGVITEFPVPTGCCLIGIAAGPDGNLWFARGRIRRITTAGVITEFAQVGAGGFIAAGPDGNLWFPEPASNKIGRITTDGVITGEFSIPTPQSHPLGIAAGPDGNLWFTEFNGNKIGRITTVHGPVVNDLVRLDSLVRSCQQTPVSGGPAGTCSFQATFSNTSALAIATPFFQVGELSGGNLLLNADGGPGGVGSRLTPDVGPDGIWSPGESLTAELVIGLQTWVRFTFFVDVVGEPGD